MPFSLSRPPRRPTVAAPPRCRRGVAAQPRLQRAVGPAGRGHRRAGGIVDGLHVDVRMLRNTASRGRSALPAKRLRCRRCTRTRRSFLVLISCTLSRCPLLRAGLAGLLLQHFAGVAHALLLVRVGLAQRTHVGRHWPTNCLSIPLTTRCVLLVDDHVDGLRQRKITGCE